MTDALARYRDALQRLALNDEAYDLAVRMVELGEGSTRESMIAAMGVWLGRDLALHAGDVETAATEVFKRLATTCRVAAACVCVVEIAAEKGPRA